MARCRVEFSINLDYEGRSFVNESPAMFERPASEHRESLERIRSGLATKVRILASDDSCPVCKAFEGAYEFDKAPELPLEGCSHPNGCRCHYEPVLDRFGP
jgi:hypothetical protein